jgi:hypothetical protein
MGGHIRALLLANGALANACPAAARDLRPLYLGADISEAAFDLPPSPGSS